MDRTKLALLATVIVLAVNAAANIVPLGGLNTGQLSALYPTGFTPPGYVFGIWSIIYLGLIAFSIAALRAVPRTRARIERIIGPYLLNAVGNCAWIIVWHSRMVLVSVLVMLFILATLIVIVWRLRNLQRPTWSEFLVVDGVFSLYFGWITTATLVNFSTLFYDWGFYPFGNSMDGWALISVCTAIAVYVWMGAVTRDVVYCAVFLWAATGIFMGGASISEPVKLAAITGVAMVATCMLWALFNPRRSATFRGP